MPNFTLWLSLFKLNISLSERYMSPGRRTKEKFLDQPYHILLRQPTSWSKIEEVCGYLDPKRNYIGLYSVRVSINTHHWFIKEVHFIMTRSCPSSHQPYTVLSTEHMLTSQIGFSLCLVPSCEDTLGRNVE